jgi:hypothetical protein
VNIVGHGAGDCGGVGGDVCEKVGGGEGWPVCMTRERRLNGGGRGR